METWSKENWDRALDKVKRFTDMQCPDAKVEVWLVGSAFNRTDYCDHLRLNVRIETDFSLIKMGVDLEKGAYEPLETTDDYLMLAAGVAIGAYKQIKE